MFKTSFHGQVINMFVDDIKIIALKKMKLLNV